MPEIYKGDNGEVTIFQCGRNPNNILGYSSRLAEIIPHRDGRGVTIVGDLDLARTYLDMQAQQGLASLKDKK
ncbi:MAG: hypothetical protein HZB67_06280 [Candidatus Aenigmarchaeota archaeon]|nr:hypothetical protein [Candidatus Aenigmarchaeota archaeon]